MYYFAYGSNLNRRQMSQRCPDAQPKFTATLPDYKLVFAGWSRRRHGGVATIKPCKAEEVIGAIYEISERCLRSLDGYEGYPTVYTRMDADVFTEGDATIKAITYLMKEPAVEARPSREYLEVIRQGYQDWGLSQAALEKALRNLA